MGLAPDTMEEEEEGQKEQKDEDNSSSEDEGFGFDEKKVADPKAEAKAKAKPGGKHRSNVPKKGQPQEKTEKSEKGAKSLEDAHTKAVTMLDSFGSFSPLASFQGNLKAKDWNSKAEKALQLCNALEGADSEYAETGAKLQEATSLMVSYMELLKQIQEVKEKDAANELGSLPQKTLREIYELPTDCLSAVLLDCGRKIMEDLQDFVSRVFRK